MEIDKKYTIIAVNRESGKVCTDRDSILFRAKDRALLPTLKAYLAECISLGCMPEHISGVKNLVDRVFEYQQSNPVKIPD